MFPSKTVRSNFADDQNGAIAILFGLFLLVFCLLIGLSVDGGRAYLAQQRTADALDAATLAAAKQLMQGSHTDAEISTIASEFFNSNVRDNPSVGATYRNVQVIIDRTSDTIAMSAETLVPTTFGRLAKIHSINFTTRSQATFSVGNLELGLVLDTTGSMSDFDNNGEGRKIDDLKTAAAQLFDTLMPDAGYNGSVRIGIAPFQASVNAGPYAAAVSNGTSTDDCVVERQGASDYSDTDPVVGGDFFQPGNRSLLNIDPIGARRPYACEPAPILPLTSDKPALKAEVDSFIAAGNTAGHLGTAWGWYLISPNWSRVWPASSLGSAYGTPHLTKAIVLMTDGAYNTAYYNGATSAAQAVALCNNAKAQGVVVYTIGFTTAPADEVTLKACASADPSSGLPRFYHADGGSDLSSAFKDIATKLTALRLAK